MSLGARAVVGVAVFAGYVATSRGLGTLYPFSTFGMYAAVDERSASRVVARGGDGRLRELRSYEAWDCGGPIDLEPAACLAHGRHYAIGYVEREAAEYLARPAPAGDARAREPVTLVRRIWRFAGPGEPTIEDCELASCRAVRR